VVDAADGVVVLMDCFLQMQVVYRGCYNLHTVECSVQKRAEGQFIKARQPIRFDIDKWDLARA